MSDEPQEVVSSSDVDVHAMLAPACPETLMIGMTLASLFGRMDMVAPKNMPKAKIIISVMWEDPIAPDGLDNVSVWWPLADDE